MGPVTPSTFPLPPSSLNNGVVEPKATPRALKPEAEDLAPVWSYIQGRLVHFAAYQKALIFGTSVIVNIREIDTLARRIKKVPYIFDQTDT